MMPIAFLLPSAVPLRTSRPFVNRATAPRMVVVDPAPKTAAAPKVRDPHFGRVITAMVTPFKKGTSEVDYNTAEQLAAHLMENGSDALVIAGTTGESPTLTWSEQYELFTVVRNVVGNKGKVIAGAGSNSTAEAVEATKRAAKLGLHGTLQVVPYYNKPPQEGLYRHFEAVANAEPDLPIMMYNIPGRTGINMIPDTTIKLSKIDNIISIKQATDNFEELMEIRNNTSKEFDIYSGDDALTLPFLSVGACGVVSVASHLIGDALQAMVRSYEQGDVAAATETHMRYADLFKELFRTANPVMVKTALRLQGWSVGGVRLPLVDAPPAFEASMASLLQELGLI